MPKGRTRVRELTSAQAPGQNRALTLGCDRRSGATCTRSSCYALPTARARARNGSAAHKARSPDPCACTPDCKCKHPRHRVQVAPYGRHPNDPPNRVLTPFSKAAQRKQTTSPLLGTEDASHLPACDTPPYRSIAKRARGRWVATPRATRVRPAGGALGGSKCALARSTHGSGGVRWVVACALRARRSARPYGFSLTLCGTPPKLAIISTPYGQFNILTYQCSPMGFQLSFRTQRNV